MAGGRKNGRGEESGGRKNKGRVEKCSRFIEQLGEVNVGQGFDGKDFLNGAFEANKRDGGSVADIHNPDPAAA